MKNLKELIQKTIYILTPTQKKLSVLVFIMTAIGSALETLGVSVIVPIVSLIRDKEAVLNNATIQKYAFTRALSYEQIVGLVVVGTIFLYFFKDIYIILMQWVRIKFATKIQRETAQRMMRSIMTLGYPYYLKHNSTEYLQSVGEDSGTLNVVINALFSIISEACTMLMIGVFLFFSDWQLASVIMVLALLCMLLIFKVFRRRVYEAGIVAREYGVKMGQTLSESYFGIKDILLFRKQKYFVYKYEENSIITQKAQCRQTISTASPAYVIEALCVSGLMLCIGVKIVFMGAGPEYISVLAAFAVGAFRVLPSMGRISSQANFLSGATARITKLYNNLTNTEKYLKEHPEFVPFMEDRITHGKMIDKGHEYVSAKKESFFSTGKFTDKLELENISFAYSAEFGYVLKDLSMSVKKGEAIGIIGESGAGKSTLVDIMLGLIVPEKGRVLLDGTDIRNIPEKWSETIAYVPQEVYICDETIKKNVAFGEREEEIDPDLVREALQKAEMLSFVEQLPDGLETTSGDRGIRMSGGQRQRIAIARALYHRPEILVLDEATSALDNNTESVIMDAINALYGQITLVIVAHRLTTVKMCDRIYQVKDGSIREVDKKELFGE